MGYELVAIIGHSSDELGWFFGEVVFELGKPDYEGAIMSLLKDTKYNTDEKIRISIPTRGEYLGEDPYGENPKMIPIDLFIEAVKKDSKAVPNYWAYKAFLFTAKRYLSDFLRGGFKEKELRVVTWGH